MSKIHQEEVAHLEKTTHSLQQTKTAVDESVADLMEEYETGLRESAAAAKRDEAMELMSGAVKRLKNLGFNQKRKWSQRLGLLLDDPYFARIDFRRRGTDHDLKLYLGRFAYIPEESEDLGYTITDWRAPVASLYYNYTGPNPEVAYEFVVTSEERPDIEEHKRVEGELKLRRTIDIENQKLLGIYDNNLKVDLLSQAIGKKAGGELGDIIETIQAQQNDIIRTSPDRVCVIQGAAGSGKTTISVHRISFLLYTFAERIKEQDILLLSSSKILVNYVTNVLPELGVYSLARDTLQRFLWKTLAEHYQKMIKEEHLVETRGTGGERKNSAEFLEALHLYAAEHETRVLRKLKKHPSYQNLELEQSLARKKRRPVYYRLRDIIEELEEWHLDLRQHTQNPRQRRGGLSPSQTDLTQNLKQAKHELDRLIKAFNPLQEYQAFLEWDQFPESLKGIEFNPQNVDVDDVSAIYYLGYLLSGYSQQPRYKQVLVDEAQDLGLLNYAAVKALGKGDGFTIFGDLNQATDHEGGIKNWNDLYHVFGRDNIDYFEIKISYRTTKEIILLARRILEKFSEFQHLPEPFRRTGEKPVVTQFNNRSAMLAETIKQIKKIRDQEENRAVAVIEPDPARIGELKEAFDEAGLETLVVTKNFKHFTKTGIYLVPESLVKGLEFDTVFVLDPNQEAFPHTPLAAKRIFVCCTRAINRLFIYHLGNLTQLLE